MFFFFSKILSICFKILFSTMENSASTSLRRRRRVNKLNHIYIKFTKVNCTLSTFVSRDSKTGLTAYKYSISSI